MKKDIHGGSPESLAKKFRLDGLPDIKIDFSVNLNPCGYPDSFNGIFFNPERYAVPYPPQTAAVTEALIAAELNIETERIVAGSGATELMGLLLRVLKPSLALYFTPTYSGYEEICSKNFIRTVALAKDLQGKTFSIDTKRVKVSNADIVFIGNPDNPTGQIIAKQIILDAATENPEKYFIIDESFMDFSFNAQETSLLSSQLPENLIVLKSLTKFYSMAGLRTGFICASRQIAAQMKEIHDPWPLNGFAAPAIKAALADKNFFERSRKLTKELREYLANKLEDIRGLECFPSETNYIFCRLEKTSSEDLQVQLMKRGILIRSCADMEGLDKSYIRLAVRSRKDTDELCRELIEILGSKNGNHNQPRRKYKDILFVGTTSDSGKSTLTAAFCRFLADKGLSPCPFKAQNMSLNSFVGIDGGEMGRAQVVQAAACRIPPHSDMNPVLLKPLGDSRSQIIINGKAVANMSAREYYMHKKEFSEQAFRTFDKLQAQYDVIVMEGAGSPAEINLLEEDFVNMRMAEYANAAAVLVADIDRGGVFASIFGTIKLLPENYRKLIKAVIINKFRGDKSLLDSGIRQIEEYTGVPVIGVMPYLKNLKIEAEDSLALESFRRKKDNPDALLKIVIVRLPRISNFTDFDAFAGINSIVVKYAENPDDLNDADMIIIPGTKNTIQDMLWMRENHIDRRIIDLAQKGKFICGICGGFQMLGEKIYDPFHMESETEKTEGLGLLPLETILEKEKILKQIEGISSESCIFCQQATPFKGYEIHSGVTRVIAGRTIQEPLKQNSDSLISGMSIDGNIFGTYVHGIFDRTEFRNGLLSLLCKRKGLSDKTVIEESSALEKAFEESIQSLVKAMKDNVNTDALMQIISRT